MKLEEYLKSIDVDKEISKKLPLRSNLYTYNLTREEKLKNRKWWFKIVDVKGDVIEEDLMSGEVKSRLKGFHDNPTSKILSTKERSVELSDILIPIEPKNPFTLWR